MNERSWNRGTPVRIRLDDASEIRGQVWEESEHDGHVWVALEDGRYAHVSRETRRAQIVDANGVAVGPKGRVAA